LQNLLIFFLLLISVSPVMAKGEDSLSLGIFPRRNAEITYKIFTPLTEHLSAELGLQVTLDVSYDFEDFWQKLASGKFDIIHCNQYHYLAARRDFNFEVIGTNSEFGKTTIAGAIVVRKDSGFQSLKDLKGKKILFGGGPTAMQSYILTTHLLRKSGLARGDYIENFAINPPNAVLAVYYQQADAGGSGDLVLQMDSIKNRIDVSQLEFLANSQQLPQHPWAVSKSLSIEIRQQIRQVLTTMEQSQSGLAALQAASLDRIIPADDQDFDPFREITLEIKGQQF
jgi:phosphonate transport system substrate-binding protein